MRGKENKKGWKNPSELYRRDKTKNKNYEQTLTLKFLIISVSLYHLKDVNAVSFYKLSELSKSLIVFHFCNCSSLFQTLCRNAFFVKKINTNFPKKMLLSNKKATGFVTYSPKKKKNQLLETNCFYDEFRPED